MKIDSRNSIWPDSRGFMNAYCDSYTYLVLFEEVCCRNTKGIEMYVWKGDEGLGLARTCVINYDAGRLLCMVQTKSWGN